MAQFATTTQRIPGGVSDLNSFVLDKLVIQLNLVELQLKTCCRIVSENCQDLFEIIKWKSMKDIFQVNYRFIEFFIAIVRRSNHYWTDIVWDEISIFA